MHRTITISSLPTIQHILVQKTPKSHTPHRYSFQGQESDNEIKGAGNSVNYKYRMHDPRVGRFFAVDPLAPKYPHNSPYAFSENVVIDHIELEGLEKYSIHHRSFAPWKFFGDFFGEFKGSFFGDNRGFSLLNHSSNTPGNHLGVSSRIYQRGDIDLGVLGGVLYTTSSITRGFKNFAGDLSSDYSDSQGEGTFNGSLLKMEFEGSDPLITIAPDIQWNIELGVKHINDQLFVQGVAEGRGFPAYESFIEDDNGIRVFLTTFSAPDRLELSSRLLTVGPGKFRMGFNLIINTDSDGNFLNTVTSVEYKLISPGYYEFSGKHHNGQYIPPVYETVYKSYTIDEWNNIILNTSPSSDCPEGDCGN